MSIFGSSGPELSEMQYGFDNAKLVDYIDRVIQAKILREMKDTINTGVKSIKNICDLKWGGEAKTRFCNNLDKDVEKLENDFQNLYMTLEHELHAIQGSMAENDKNMIAED